MCQVSWVFLNHLLTKTAFELKTSQLILIVGRFIDGCLADYWARLLWEVVSVDFLDEDMLEEIVIRALNPKFSINRNDLASLTETVQLEKLGYLKTEETRRTEPSSHYFFLKEVACKSCPKLVRKLQHCYHWYHWMWYQRNVSKKCKGR